MCRACYAVVIAAEPEQQRLRRAAGLEVQVLATGTSFDAAKGIDPAPDVVIVHATAPEPPAERDAAIVWVGDAAPEWADVSVPDDPALPDALPGAVVRALIARRSR